MRASIHHANCGYWHYTPPAATPNPQETAEKSPFCLAGSRATVEDGVDIAGLSLAGSPAGLSAADFAFKVGNSNASGSWPDAPAPTSQALERLYYTRPEQVCQAVRALVSQDYHEAHARSHRRGLRSDRACAS